MSTALFSHPDCLAHLTPPRHPEQPARLHAITRALAAPEFDALLRLEAPLAIEAEIARVHATAYIERIKAAIPASGTAALDPDTHVSPGSYRAALRAVGANVAAVDLVLSGRVRSAFCAIRPPGHHALRDQPMGFCLFDNIAIAAKYALDHHNLKRIAIVDFDVHHGNGTQAALWDEPRALFISTHQMPHWPGSGAPDERGAHNNILNIPLAPGSGGAVFRREVTEHALPRLESFRPELLLVSAGFDAHAADPLSDLRLVAADFAWISERICDVAEAHAQGRVVSTLEGGYDLDALAASVAAHVRVLMERGR